MLEERSRYVFDKELIKQELRQGQYFNAIEYYYAVRCMAVHRGKATREDAKHITGSLKELSQIFGYDLAEAKKEATDDREKFRPAR